MAESRKTASNNQDRQGASFNERCYELLRKVPRGKVTTYGELARALGTRAYRAVGHAMHVNPYAPAVPCHRVVSSNGKLGGFASGPRNKTRMLTREGVRVRNSRIVDFEAVLFKF